MFEVRYPVGWNKTTFIPCQDKDIHHILTFDHVSQEHISVVLHWNKSFQEILQDPKYGFNDRHYHLKLSLDEAKALRDALDFHIKNVENRNEAKT